MDFSKTCLNCGCECCASKCAECFQNLSHLGNTNNKIYRKYNVLIINSCISVTGFIVLPSFRFLTSQSAHSSLLLPLHFTLYTIYMNMNQTKEDNIKIVENLNAVHAHNWKYINKNINASLISLFFSVLSFIP